MQKQVCTHEHNEGECCIQTIKEDQYVVTTGSGFRPHKVKKIKCYWHCSCNKRLVRTRFCIHILLVMEYLKSLVRKINIRPIEPTRCPCCKSTEAIKKGKRRNKNYDVQRHKCKKCGKQFSGNLGFERMRTEPRSITLGMDMYFSGLSVDKTRQILERDGAVVSSTTIHEWVAKYTEKLYKYLHKLRPRIGVKWHTDEMYIKIGGETKWLFAITDHVTRFWIVYELGSTKKGHNATRMFVNASKYTKIIPKEISSDSSPVYPFAINAAYQNAITKLIKHKKDNHLQNKYNNNNEQERFNGTQRS